MRTTIQIYRQLGKFLEVVDMEAQARDEGPEDKTIDAHFRSGVYLGVGMTHIILSLMPSKLLAVVELFGYKGDRHEGLAMLQKAGGWTSTSSGPAIGKGIAAVHVLTSWQSDVLNIFTSSVRGRRREEEHMRYVSFNFSPGPFEFHVRWR